MNNASLKKLFVAPSVMTIEKSAFENVPLTSIEFSPDANLVTIGENAFKGSQVINVNFPNSLKEIQAGAFENSYVSAANLPNVTTIGERAFKNAALLTSITLGEELETMGD
ncbi:MAG: leucine-rich repeat domain-containing protein, partial [Clostridia bacterium]|nr:leucine-rich repeat domain-containing protein [Clostridia bacterium]